MKTHRKIESYLRNIFRQYYLTMALVIPCGSPGYFRGIRGEYCIDGDYSYKGRGPICMIKGTIGKNYGWKGAKVR